MRRSDQ